MITIHPWSIKVKFFNIVRFFFRVIRSKVSSLVDNMKSNRTEHVDNSWRKKTFIWWPTATSLRTATGHKFYIAYFRKSHCSVSMISRSFRSLNLPLEKCGSWEHLKKSHLQESCCDIYKIELDSHIPNLKNCSGIMKYLFLTVSVQFVYYKQL